ncbi:MAG: cysteine desulfurase NifS [Candidatus Magasanikbacteria bacterium CG10_big_fil_rev_8_21_14_0_10_43_6]|uniref:Cysteine desulfurase NifS n=1 Tax=Candidatus Magasanikbacteria bacterium CG10_big_fil_rev_8_21_14_0_10_43_6 TaxID=1974650 RepID=A0A2M6W1A5_9BACT|nr:MAG: cysteine desulfurase NifS [Candidatus Magasanikbacteria bacterium CG10_big_fil_rev_8_21_14_0_10_43_6]
MFPQKPEEKKMIYLDHAATTYMDPAVKDAMDPYFSDLFANSSGLYAIGRQAREAIDDARRTVADLLGTQVDTIIFTGGGTESDNMAVFGVALHKKIEQLKQTSAEVKGHIITTKVEHHAVLHPCEELEKQGFDVTYLKPNQEGYVSAAQVKDALREDTLLVSIMYANNEIGTVMPIAEIGREILKWRKEHAGKYPYFHTDACQASGALSLDVEKLHVDLMTINGSKMYGPKGVGMLYKRRGINLKPLIIGGGQEMKMRSGTENVPGIVGFAKALELAQSGREAENIRLRDMRAYFWEQLKAHIPKIRLNGPPLSDETVRLPNNLNISILDIEGEALLLYLDEYGIICSTGSACTSESLDPSHVLLACGLPYEYAHGSLRFTLGKRNTKKDIDYVMNYLPAIVARLREISPVNLSYNPDENKHAQYLQR